MRKQAVQLGLSVLFLVCAAGIAAAQTVPFGKNKIQYRDFEWRVLAGEHVDVYYYPEEVTIARLTLAYAEESYAYLERKFQHHPFQRIPLIVYSSHQHFEQTNIFPGFIPEGVLGFTEYLKRRVALPFRGDYAQFRHTLRHELVHFFQLSKIAEVQRLHGGRQEFTPQQVLWWTEGLAEFWSSEQTPEDEMFNRDLVLHGRLPTIAEFGRQRGFAAYPLGGELHEYLADRFGEEYIVELYDEFWKYDSFEAALEGVLGMELDRLSREWQYDLEQQYFPEYGRRPPLDLAADPVIHEGGANVKPTVYQPPGDTAAHLFFLSPRTGYTNIYRTSLDTGEEGVEAVVQGERSAEFESFHAYESRIDVNEDGLLVFVSKYLERDALFVWDLREDEVVGRYQWPDLVGMKSPSWDPTGTRVAFEGLSTRGFSDLYTIDFETQQRTALTEDRFRDRDPDWSPDGESIVFASDRTEFGEEGYRNLFLYDLETGGVRYLTYGPWRDQTPRWSHDGSRIAFSSDRTGSWDLYTVDRTGHGRQVTTVTGGAFDPAWMPDDEGLVFAGFGGGRYRIFEYPLDADTAGRPTIALRDTTMLPLVASRTGPDSTASRDLGWSWTDLETQDLEEAEQEEYSALGAFSLDFAGGQATVAPGYGSAQGAQFLATDMLGNHMMFAGFSAIQAESLSDAIDNFSGQFLYLNLSHRLNYGAGLYRFRGRFYDVALDVYQERSYGGYFLASYPFSKYRRLELNLGVARSDRDDLDDTFPGTLFTSQDLRGGDRELTRTGLLTNNYISYVKDNTLWLPTGPIDGERYNITTGLVTCFSCSVPSALTGTAATRGVTAENYVLFGDYRRYFRTSMLTAYAFRAYGYYSTGEIPGRAVLGGPHRLRGYPRFSLAGSRVWLINQEWRFPILHGLSVSFPFGNFGFPGIQGAIFTDAGSSWLEDGSPNGTWGSYGLGFRTSLGAALVLRLDVGRRFKIGGAPPVDWRDGEFDDTFVDFFFGYNY